jgi:RNA polymerase sigma-70 factor, ECF subfamily
MGAKRVGSDLSCAVPDRRGEVSALQNIQEVRLSVKDSGIITLVGATPFRLRRQPHMDKAKPARPASQAAKNPTEAESSVELLARARAGDSRALDNLFTRYLPRLERWAHGRLPVWARDARETQDLVQDTLTQVFLKVQSFEPRHEGAFYAYMRQALMNRVRDEIRRAHRHAPAEVLDSAKSDLGPSPLEEAIGHETLERYEAALDRLRQEDREAIIMRIEMGLSYEEIVKALGKPSVAAAHMAVSRALVKLAQEMSRVRR